MTLRILTAALCAVAFSASSAAGQGPDRPTLAGTVTGPDGGGLAGASVANGSRIAYRWRQELYLDEIESAAGAGGGEGAP